ncbi:MAG: methyltransferase domain-containing protein [Chloroflexi bacterium]|nr:methyltransferase domain-containing protein [Chloroflexota bacterium]
MNHADHVALLRPGIPTPGGTWADLGSGGGAFTLALADLLGPDGEIHAVDRDQVALLRAGRAVRERFPAVTVRTHTADFTRALGLPPLDGVVMANALHYVQHKRPVLAHVARMLKPGGRFILVEYDTDRGNNWVPYPLAFTTWKGLTRDIGWEDTTLLATRPSRFLGRIYSALSILP